MENTSGQGEAADVPREIIRWNWGAFFLNWIWGIRNKTYIAFFCILPIVGFVMMIVLAESRINGLTAQTRVQVITVSRAKYSTSISAEIRAKSSFESPLNGDCLAKKSVNSCIAALPAYKYEIQFISNPLLNL